MTKRSILWNFNSKHAAVRPLGSNTSRAVFNLNDAINLVGDEKKMYITARYADIPNTDMVISDTYGNNYFDFSTDGGTTYHRIHLRSGTYQGAQMAAMVQASLRRNVVLITAIGAADRISVSFVEETNEFVFALAGNSAADIAVIFSNNTVGEMMGFPYREVELIPNVLTPIVRDLLRDDTLVSEQAADPIPNILRVMHTNLNIQNVFTSRSGGRSNILEYYARGAGTRSTFANMSTDVRAEILNRHVSSIEIWFTDTNNVPIDFRGLHWSVTLLFEIE